MFKRTIKFYILVALLSFASLAFTHGVHKAQHGGIVKESKDYVFELVAKSEVISLYIYDHQNKPLATTGASGEIQLTTGKEQTLIKLAPSSANALQATGQFKIEKGSKAQVKVLVGSAIIGNIRYILK